MSSSRPALRRLDHVAILVSDTDSAMERFARPLGLEVAHSEEIESPPARLTYLDCGNAYIQLVEPLADDGPLREALDRDGEGLHHICFGVDDVRAAVTAVSGRGPEATGSGRGRISAFVPESLLSTTVEVTEFDRAEDVVDAPGWIPDAPADR